MSAIYGVIDFHQGALPEELPALWQAQYKKYCIERFDAKQTASAFMGCGLQYFTPESHWETLPIYDGEKRILFTADCILDNREEIFQALVQAQDSQVLAFQAQRESLLSASDFAGSSQQPAVSDANPCLPDGSLMYRAYLLWGKDCVKHFRGVFSLAIYEEDKQELTLFSDQFSNRCLFYTEREGRLYFSTLLQPLVKASGLKFQENQRWLLDSISVRGPIMMIEREECAYQDIYKVPCGHYITFSLKEDIVEKEKTCYYNPVAAIKVDKKQSEKEASARLHEALLASTKACIHTDGQVAAKLSSGLDSTTVAGFAAPLLQEEGKKLYAFTSVPEDSPMAEQAPQTQEAMEELLKKAPLSKEYHVADESAGVLRYCLSFPNILPTFVSCPGQTILGEYSRLIEEWELPCKSQQNAVWLSEITKKAKEKGCHIIFSGAIGNTTISAGNIDNLFYQELRSGHWIKLSRDFLHYMDSHHGNKKGYARQFAKTLWSGFFENKSRAFLEMQDTIVTRRDLQDKYNNQKRYYGYIYGGKPFSSFAKCREQIYLADSYAQIGEIDTKDSLRYGILERDPCRDVNVINTLCSFPMKMFVNENHDRRLVREFMADVVPDFIRKDYRHRGRQSADNVKRIQKIYDQMLPEIKETLYDARTLQYLSKEDLDQLLDSLTRDNLEEKEGNLLLLMDVFVFAKYLKWLDQN